MPLWAANAARPQRGRLVLLGLVLVAAVIVAGSPQLDAPWILGDEFVFIVDNPDVNPASIRRPAAVRLLRASPRSWRKSTTTCTNRCQS